MADIPSRKPILTIEQQIEHLRRKGVSFELCSEAEAARILPAKITISDSLPTACCSPNA